MNGEESANLLENRASNNSKKAVKYSMLMSKNVLLRSEIDIALKVCSMV